MTASNELLSSTVSQPSTTSAERRAARLVPKWRDVDLVRLRFEHVLNYREHRRPRILFLADRNVLVDDPKDKTFAPFGDARWKIQGEAIKSREMYFATYQAIARDERR